MAIDQHVHRLTVEEYRQVVDSGALRTARVELLDGLLVDMSPHSEPHVRVIQELDVCFTGDRRSLRTQASLAVGDGWVPEPDFAIAPRNPDAAVWPTSAVLVAEVAVSSRQRDLRKAGVYAAAGVPVYWLIDVQHGVVLEHIDPGADGYGVVRTLRGDDVLDAGLQDMTPITVAALLAR